MKPVRIDLSRYVVIPVWYGCNSKCLICMLSSVRGNLQPIGFEVFKDLVIKVVNEGKVKNLVLSGGEVTTFDHLVSYVEFVASFGYFEKIQVQTNARKLKDRDYLKSLINAGVNEFFISLHGPAAINDAITGIDGSYEETIRGIGNLEEFPVNIITNTVLTRLNAYYVPQLLTDICATKVSEMHLWNFFPMEGADPKNLIVGLKDLLGLLQRLLPTLKSAGKPLVLKAFPECLPVRSPVVVDSDFPLTLIPDIFWKGLQKSGFGACVYRNECRAERCWGLSRPYLEKYGGERDVLKPFRQTEVPQ